MTDIQKQAYTVNDIARILNISRTHAYELVGEDAPFRVVRAGKCIRIPIISFDQWFSGSADNNGPVAIQNGTSLKGGK